MPKRGRPQNETEGVDGDPGLLPDRVRSIQEKQVEQQIVIGKKALNRALKLAKGFERQKLGRRLKAARAEGDAAGVTRLDSEVEVLKVLNLPSLAEAHIYKALAKSKNASHPPVWASISRKASQTGKIEQGIVLNNVTARLYNSNPVKAAVADILKAVQITLGLGGLGGHENQKPQKRRKGDESQTFNSGHLALGSIVATEDASARVESGARGRNRSSSKRATDISSSEDGQQGTGTKYNGRMAGNENEEYNFGCGSEDDLETPQGRGALSKAYDPEADLSLSSPTSEGSSSTLPPLKSRKREKPPVTPKSTFLPSLMGGYWSGSESAEDEGVGLQPRKNRMGQRARRQLWEKRYGVGANHLKGTTRDKDWDPKRGVAIDNRGGARPARDGSSGIGVAAKYSRTGGRSGEGRSLDKPRPPAKKIDEGPLHPSWEAAKNAKRQAMQATFKGKKIVFD
ncbi:MAG: hypothetical protein M1839_009328 [Geoglossum umbratile]|nr:MAG: hypothetical protein M1839_009328 [Geoglossum umbratile]